MTCAACARAIERKLGKTAGVDRASVNLATSMATVEFDPARVQISDFIGVIEDLGYGVPEVQVPASSESSADRWRLIVAAICAIHPRVE